jgi:hypothetical protein
MDHLYTCPESGRQYGRGCNPKPLQSGLPLYGPAAGFPTYSLDQIAALVAKGAGDLSCGLKVILNQGRYGLCWDYAATQALMVDRVLKGQAFTLLDVSVGPVLTGNGLNTGGAIEDMLTKVQLITGQPPASIIPGSDPVNAKLNLNTRQWPANWKEVAAGYKVLQGKWLECPTVVAMASAIIDGHPVVMGVNWQGGGHALCVLKVSVEKSELQLWGPNSWGADWQSGYGAAGPEMPGWYKLSASRCQAMDSYGAYALCAETYSGDDPEPK